MNSNKYFSSLKSGLDCLVIFRGLLSNPTLKSLYDLLGELSKVHFSTDAGFSPVAYADFLSNLCHANSARGKGISQENLTRFIWTLIKEDENFYLKGHAAGAIFSKEIEECLNAELALLCEISKLRAADIKAILCSSDISPKISLPAWETEDLNFLSLYREKLSLLSQKGMGLFEKYHMFCLKGTDILPVKHPDSQALADLCGYERERGLVIKNTLSLLAGEPANNVLLYGDAGTGKSSAVKAIANEFKDQGLRLVEITKDQLPQLGELMEELSQNPLKFIIFIDDLSFNVGDGTFSSLKGILEGNVFSRGSNTVIYATSNRRHMIKETFSERNGDELYLNDTLQEIMSLSARFGLTVTFGCPDRDNYLEIVSFLAEKYGLALPSEELAVRAEAFAIRNNGRSPRTAKQFVIFEQTLLNQK